MDKKTFSICLAKLCEVKKCFKNEILKITHDIIRKEHMELNNKNSDVIDIAVSYDSTWQKLMVYIALWDKDCSGHFNWPLKFYQNTAFNAVQ